MPRTKLNLSRILLDSRKLTEEELQKALSIQRRTGKELKEILISEGFLTEEEILSAIAYYFNIPFLDPSKYEIDPKIVTLIPEDLARNYSFFPLYKIGNTLLIAVAEPLDIITTDNLSLSIGCEIKQVLAKEKIVSDCINNFYTNMQTLPKILKYEESLEIVKQKKSRRC